MLATPVVGSLIYRAMCEWHLGEIVAANLTAMGVDVVEFDPVSRSAA
jgi:hypothetical protein